jgi:hypothetical protein
MFQIRALIDYVTSAISVTIHLWHQDRGKRCGFSSCASCSPASALSLSRTDCGSREDGVLLLRPRLQVTYAQNDWQLPKHKRSRKKHGRVGAGRRGRTRRIRDGDVLMGSLDDGRRPLLAGPLLTIPPDQRWHVEPDGSTAMFLDASLVCMLFEVQSGSSACRLLCCSALLCSALLCSALLCSSLSLSSPSPWPWPFQLSTPVRYVNHSSWSDCLVFSTLGHFDCLFHHRLPFGPALFLPPVQHRSTSASVSSAPSFISSTRNPRRGHFIHLLSHTTPGVSWTSTIRRRQLRPRS